MRSQCIPVGPRNDRNRGPVPGDPSSQGSSLAREAVTGVQGSCSILSPCCCLCWKGLETGVALAEICPHATLNTDSGSLLDCLLEDASGGYMGLRNQGSTCYLNSLLQCLFFTPEFRKAILSCDHVGDSSIVYRLKTLFEQLMGESSAPSTEGITRCLGVTNVHQQQDVAEYFRILMNKIIEDKHEVQQEIQQLYQVEMVHSITCCKCWNVTTIPEIPVLSLSLSLKCTCKMDIFSVLDALHDVQKENDFTEDDQVYCEACESKENATSRYSFKTLPPILVLNLKRYQFDGAGFRKLHCNLSVPFSLTMELEKQSEVHYELFAVCHHQGGIHGGHYVAEIKPDKSEFWYHFNDTEVRKVPEKQNTTGTKDSPTAYLLMYRTTNSVAEPQKESKDRKTSKMSENTKHLEHCSFQAEGREKEHKREMEFDRQATYQKEMRHGQDTMGPQRTTAGNSNSPKTHKREWLCPKSNGPGAITKYFRILNTLWMCHVIHDVWSTWIAKPGKVWSTWIAKQFWRAVHIFSHRPNGDLEVGHSSSQIPASHTHPISSLQTEAPRSSSKKHLSYNNPILKEPVGMAVLSSKAVEGASKTYYVCSGGTEPRKPETEHSKVVKTGHSMCVL